MQVGSEQGQVVPAPQSPPPIVTATDMQTPTPSGDAKPASQSKPGTAGDGKTMVIPHSAMTRIKQEERERGKKSALEEWAKEQGFESVEKLHETVRMAKAAPQKNGNGNGNGKQHAQPNTNGNGNKQMKTTGKEADRAERLRKQYETKMAELSREKRQVLAKNKSLQRQLDAREAEMALREKAIELGARDVDYAVRLLTRDLDGKSEEELAKFDEAKWFASLRESKPYLFGEVVRPATTGTGASGAPSPRPGEVMQATATVNKTDVSKMSREDYHKRLASMGLQVPV